ncbi:PTS mannitol transporter subunit IICBA [Anaerotignum lactatifermentans]
MKNSIQKFGKFLSAMVMPNIGAFIAWGFITALFIEAGWIPNERLATLVDPMLKYLIPTLIAFQGGRMVGGDRGGVMGAVATLGVIAGSEQTMLIGAMAMGPFAGLVIKKFDKAVEGKIPAGFEMLVNNFSVGIFGMILAIIGYYLIGPVMATILAILTAGVKILVTNKLLPFVAIFVEPAKVLFLNNAINHGIFTPIGIEQAAETGKSIMYMLEANPGPGLGVLLAYWVFSKDKVTKSSAPGAVIIHFFGGIHEIYFPYVLMNPVIIIAPIVASIVTIFYYSIMGAGLVGPASPGSIIAFLAVAPKGETLKVLIGVVLAAAVSFVVASPIVKLSGNKNLDEATDKMKNMKAEAKGLAKANGEIKKIVFACDAGMGSSAMGATKFRNRIAPLNLGITVINTSVDNVPADADVVVCQAVLQDRAKASAPQAELITIGNFLADPNLDALYASLEAKASGAGEQPAAEVKAEETTTTNNGIMVAAGIKTGQASVSKEEAITAAGKLLHELGYVNESYIPAMLEREKTVSTYMGLGVAIPHGTSEAKDEVKKTGIVMLQYPEGVDFGDEKAYLVFGIAGIGNEHLDLLAKIGTVIEEEENLDKLKKATTPEEIPKMFQ